jgi:predicted MFS family arabinose efflux permease
MTEHSPPSLSRRLLPLRVGVGLQGLILWVPVEKVFITEIGFTAASVGVLAAAYAAVVPLFEVPSGVLADRWSRSWIMVGASVALAASSLVGGLSTNVAMYVVAAMILGVYFAMNSGTVDSIVYDVVMEETGSNDLYEMWIGRVRMVESGAFVASALVGGVLAGWTSARLTYFASIPFVALATVAFLRFDEPRLHRSSEPVALRRHVATTLRAMTRQDVLQVMLLAAVAALISQAIFEFGPLWLVNLDAPPALFGPYWAVLVSTLGLGGFLISKLRFDRQVIVVGLACAGPAAALALTISHSLTVVIVAQGALALLIAIVGIHAGRLMHDAVPSSIRSGVSSGVGTLSWMLFLPFSLVFGWLADQQGVNEAGWMLTGAAVLVAALLVVSVVKSSGRPAPGVEAVPTCTDIACKELVELITDYLDGVLPADWRAGVDDHLPDCDGCTEYTRQIRFTLQALRSLSIAEGPRPVIGSTDTTG